MPNPTKTQAIKAFLQAKTHSDLASLYNHDMECQVIVAQDHGERIDGEYKGRKWSGYTDGIQVWKPFRIPRNADSEPEYTDSPITWDLNAHAEAIGMTGWDWVSKCSRWVAFDFDAITGHSDKHSSKLSIDELRLIQNRAREIPWVTVRKSTSGQGLHLYVFLDSVSTANHTEHSALARAILAKMSALTGFDFVSKVDICGGNMWVWHRRMRNDGLVCIKQGDILTEIPSNWRDHLNVIKGKRKKIRHKISNLSEVEEKFDQITGQHLLIKLDDVHLRLIRWLDGQNRFFWWDSDNHMLVTHTKHLKDAHEALGLKGIFETNSPATNVDEQNCFAFPLRRGAWVIRRYSLGCVEHPSWEQDGQGWTKCYLNRDPNLKTASAAYNGLEDPSGGFVFQSGAEAQQAALALGADLGIPPGYDIRQTTIKPHKDGRRIVVEFNRQQEDNPSKLPGWLQKGNKWVKIFSASVAPTEEFETDDYDDVIRHLVTIDGSDSGWVINSDGRWHDEPLNHVKTALQSMNLKTGEINKIVGGSIFKPWILVNMPFQSEYPGNRQWNRRAPQLRFAPSSHSRLNYDTWMMILNHIGQALTSELQSNEWAKRYGIKTGADYLKCWIASMIQHPLEPLPYLFIYSEAQNTGKSIFHEALSLLFHPGYCRADHALTSSSAFNGELEGAILCVVEETDLNKNVTAYNRIKDWVTAKLLPIHRKMHTPYHIANSTHWVQCANNRNACPVFTGDTRITMLHVENPPKKQIPKRDLLQILEKEAPDFLAEMMQLELPSSNDRLFIPVIETSDKRAATEANKSALEVFIAEKCYYAPGYYISLADFYRTFIEWLDPSERFNWASKQRVSRAMPDKFPKGRLSKNPNWHWGNISFSPPKEKRKRLVSVNNVLVEDHSESNT